jgi:hypothetical protein
MSPSQLQLQAEVIIGVIAILRAPDPGPGGTERPPPGCTSGRTRLFATFGSGP